MKATLLAVAAGLCWGVGEVFTKSVLHSGRIGPLTALAVRSTMSLPLVWLACALLARASGEPGRWWEAGAATLLKLGLGRPSWPEPWAWSSSTWP